MRTTIRSLHITRELKSYPNVGEVKYQRDLVDKVNANIAKISIVLLALAVLLTVVSFSLINNTVKLGIYARRFSIHTMKLVGASWGFIRRPFLRQAVLIGLLASILACAALGGCFYALYYYEPEIVSVLTLDVLAITAGAVFFIGYSHHGVLCHTVGKQVPEDEGRRPLQDLNNS